MSLTLAQWAEERWLFAKAFGRELRSNNFRIGAMGPTCGAVRRAIFRQIPRGVRRVVNIGQSRKHETSKGQNPCSTVFSRFHPFVFS